jgi:hypothetical protein
MRPATLATMSILHSAARWTLVAATLAALLVALFVALVIAGLVAGSIEGVLGGLAGVGVMTLFAVGLSRVFQPVLRRLRGRGQARRTRGTSGSVEDDAPRPR